MADTMTTARTVVGLFETMDEADRAFDALVEAGFDRDSIGIIAGHDLSKPQEHVQAKEDSEGKMLNAVEKGLGYGGGLGALAGGVASLLVPGVGPVMFGGALAAAFLGGGLGAAVGGVMAGLMKAGVDESDARLFEAALRHGGVVLTVHTDEARCRHAIGILDANGAMDMDSHRDVAGDRGTDTPDGATDNRRNDTHRDHSTPRDHKNFGTEYEAMAQSENDRRLEPWQKHGAILGGNAKPDDFDDDFHRDYQNRYAGTGVGFDRYQPSYRMGQEYARDSRFLDRDWFGSEEEIRRDWQARHRDSKWEDFKDAVRHGWDRVRGA